MRMKRSILDFFPSKRQNQSPLYSEYIDKIYDLCELIFFTDMDFINCIFFI